MKLSAFLTLIIILMAININAATYYVDATNGNDNNNGLSSLNAWKSVLKVNNSNFRPGDEILFKRNEIWREGLSISSSGQEESLITYGAYGIGKKPKITTTKIYSSWVESGQNGEYFIDGIDDNIIIAMEDGYRLDGNVAMEEMYHVMDGRAASQIGSLAPGQWAYDINYMRLYYKPSSGNPVEHLIEISSDYNFALSVREKQYILVQDLEFYGGSYIINIKNSENTTIKDCELHAGLRGVEILFSHYTNISNNIIYDVLWKGIKVGNGSNNTEIINNIVHTINTLSFDYTDAQGICVGGGWNDRVLRPENVLIMGNHVYNIGSNRSAIGLGMHFAGIIVDSANDVTVTRNIINNCFRKGIQILSGGLKCNLGPRGGDALNITVSLNVIYNCGMIDTDNIQWISNGIRISARSEGKLSGKIVNNIIANSNWEAPIPEGAIKLMSFENNWEIDVEIKNNIIYKNSGGYAFYIIDDGTGILKVDFDNNIIFHDQREVIRYNSMIYDKSHIIGTTLGYFTNDTGMGYNILMTDPSFVDADNADFHLKSNSPAINAGADVNLSEDIEGNPVPNGAVPDIGVYEQQIDNPTQQVLPPENLKVIH